MAIPITTLNARYSSDGASETGWQEGEERLRNAEVYWLSTVRPDGRPHTTPLIAIWMDATLFFATGPAERKARNLESQRGVTVTTGCNRIGEGLDVVVEGRAVRLMDEALLRRLASQYEAKYGWYFEVRDGRFWNEDHEAHVFGIEPEKAFGFRKGTPFSQTRWLFQEVGHGGRATQR